MDWKINVQLSPRRGKIVRYSSVADNAGDTMLAPLVDFWEKLATEVRKEYAGTHEHDWEVLYCELWPDTGRVIGYPGLQTRERRIDRISVQLELRSVEEAYFELTKLTGPEGFDASHSQLMGSLTKALIEAARSPRVAGLLRAILSHGQSIEILEYDDNTTVRHLRI